MMLCWRLAVEKLAKPVRVFFWSFSAHVSFKVEQPDNVISVGSKKKEKKVTGI